MMHTATGCGCTKDIGRSKARVPQHCHHGNLYTYDKALGRSIADVVSDELGPRISPRRRSSLKRGKGFGASPAQRSKVAGEVCVGCGREGTEDGSVVIDPAHLWPRSKGGCDDPDCVLGLCRVVGDGSGCHRLFDEGKLDLLERLTGKETFATELAHPILAHGVGLVELVRRLSGNGFEFVRRGDD
jgi:hypothetical protein